MPGYEYKVLPAPRKGEKAKGVKTPEARFAHAVETLINRMAAEGWEYQRADFLPSDERSGLTSTVTQWRNLLVFRRARVLDEFQARPLAEPAAAPPAPPPVAPVPAAVADPAPEPVTAAKD